ncbi:hypothetical protein CNMCM8812_003859 [Aspergillus fumigatus]|nr:hypothetical protein CNMCM8714_004125 [Aspergillus fumigatus]KAF4256391.1 hypothetical protein CNMCM8057_004129 [Aspergillus fumigatus]KAF4263829.1 hypothetical protein CNMCM8812_003859 [Aspergillus fumigatus]KAH1305381.1 hypothetical protein KXX11_009864 [Aspergillus fumigatus]KAH1522919.1 hypothetical protein KXX29_009410 [Aspergillus fumigatus]
MSLDETLAEKKPQTPTTNSIKSETNLLDALDSLEILPQILQEGILFAGSGTALLLQAATPEIRNDHDKANNGPNLATELGNALQAMLSYVSCLVFATRQEKKTLLDMLNRGQPPLRGSEHYYAAAPDVQLWIAATLYATATDFYQRIYGRVDYRTAEKAYAEFGLLVHTLGLPSGVWPETRQKFWTYWDDRIERLTVTPDANMFAKDLLHDKAVPRWVQMLKPFLRVVTIEMLPPRLREEYGLKSTMGTRGLYRSTMGFSNAVYPALPVSLRSYPLRYYLNELRKHLNVV